MEERHRDVLIALIREYIDSAQPVGSRLLARRYFRKLSPATIRNVMSDLEETGYLETPLSVIADTNPLIAPAFAGAEPLTPAARSASACAMTKTAYAPATTSAPLDLECRAPHSP